MSEEPIDIGPEGVPAGGPTLLCLGVDHRTAGVELREELQRGWSRLEGVAVHAPDDLGVEADEAMSRPREVLPQVRELLARELEAVDREGRFLTVEPAIRDLRRWSEEVCASELSRLRRSLGDLDEETWREIQEFSRSLTDKLLHDPTTRLRESVARGSTEEHLRALRRLFGLELRRRRDSASA
ncbi:MAG TPA: hypothetical protein VMT85_22220 [Thermoanaerobaculia bacterium]|nr:hypothetical protein [Thermoanaerobaculia bacterium]